MRVLGSRICAALAVALVLALAGAGGAAGASAPATVPDLAPRPTEYPRTVTERDVPIVMRDGTTLSADVTRPARADGTPAPGRFPALLTQTPYNKNVLGAAPGIGGGITSAPPSIVQRGYVSVVVDVRGTGSSGGEWQLLGAVEQRDGYDMSQWIRRQPWSDGTFGMIGGSYMAITQLHTAAQRPPGLKAIFPIIPSGDLYRDIVFKGGAFNISFMPAWAGLVLGAGLIPPGYALDDPGRTLQNLVARLTGVREPLKFLGDYVTRGELAFDGPWYAERSPLTRIGRIDVPTFIVGGWWDLFQRSEALLYDRLALEPGRKQLLMGPWYHLNTGAGLSDGDPRVPRPLDQLALAWFDRWLKGIRNGVTRFGPVTSYELGSERWTTQARWPAPRTRWSRLYLRPERSGSRPFSAIDGSLGPRPAAQPATHRMVGNPVNGVCSRATAQWTGGLVVPGTTCTEDNRAVELAGMSYTTAARRKPLRIEGPLSLTLRASTTARDLTWIATLTEVAPDGRSRSLTSGWLMPSRRAIDRSRSVLAGNGDLAMPFHPFTKASLKPVVPGKPEELAIELFPTNAVIRPGHRLRLVLTHSEVPHTLATVPELLGTLAGEHRVHLDPAQPSFLTLPTGGRRAVFPARPEPARANARRAR